VRRLAVRPQSGVCTKCCSGCATHRCAGTVEVDSVFEKEVDEGLQGSNTRVRYNTLLFLWPLG
jgi:hypothetical protein